MGELVPSPTHVFDVDRNAIEDPHRLKALIAMQAVVQLVDGDPAFVETDQELQAVAAVTGTASTPTYEDLIFSNPLAEGGYVMSRDPDTAQHEANFYRGHARIEQRLARAIEAIQVEDIDLAALAIRRAARMFQSDFNGSLDTRAFSAFRPYFKGINDYPGASGLYT